LVVPERAADHDALRGARNEAALIALISSSTVKIVAT
jgi:hypothetical protein